VGRDIKKVEKHWSMRLSHKEIKTCLAGRAILKNAETGRAILE